jgi:hypothetical protein
MSKRSNDTRVPNVKPSQRFKTDTTDNYANKPYSRRAINALSDSVEAEFAKADSIYNAIGDNQGVGIPDDMDKVNAMSDRLSMLEAKRDSARFADRRKKNGSKKPKK